MQQQYCSSLPCEKKMISYGSLQWTSDSYFISSCQRSTVADRARLERRLCGFGAVWQSGAFYLSARPCLINYRHLEMILQGRYDLSGLDWLSSDDCGRGDEEWVCLFSWLVDLQIGDINLFILGACQLHRTAAPTVKQTTGKQTPLQEGKRVA